ncbi:hypothetical protein ZIOFF_005586 [Zingiber officinale]|uniref:SLC26A/SulP transporter domain-containing protein n=1 Tax=Zingiber officinale TaxID=94328 RepID=A0A8J5IAZ9_ZINOF|nr:hypothetical protein ZIOFF_005586 [Zingiber officinale]
MEVNLRRKGSFTSLREDLRETFLPKDPFRYRLAEAECHQSSRSTLMLMYLVTILEWGQNITLLSSNAISSSASPSPSSLSHKGISYARLAYLHPFIGLYSNFIPPLIYAIFGSSTNVAMGGTAAV